MAIILRRCKVSADAGGHNQRFVPALLFLLILRVVGFAVYKQPF